MGCWEDSKRKYVKVPRVTCTSSLQKAAVIMTCRNQPCPQAAWQTAPKDPLDHMQDTCFLKTPDIDFHGVCCVARWMLQHSPTESASYRAAAFFFFPYLFYVLVKVCMYSVQEVNLFKVIHPVFLKKVFWYIYLFLGFICGMQWDSFAWLQVSLDFMSTTFQNKPNFTQTFS